MPPRNATSRRPLVGNRCPGGARSRRRPRARARTGTRGSPHAAASRSVCSLTSNGTKRVIVPASRSASSRMRVLSEVPEPSSTSVSAPVTAAISSRALHEDRPLAPGRVVLGQARDVVEELRPARVVEPLRRDVLGGRAQPAVGVGAERGAQVVGGEVHVDAWRRRRCCWSWGSSLSVVMRPPRGVRPRTASGCRAERSCGKWRGRATPGVMHAPPRSTICPLMNLPLYSPTAPGAGRSADRADRRSPSTATRRRTPARARGRAGAARRGADERAPGAESGRPAFGGAIATRPRAPTRTRSAGAPRDHRANASAS